MRKRARQYGGPDDDPLAYLTSDSPSPYLFESRLAMFGLFFARGRAATGWQRWVVLMLRAAFALLLCLIVTGVVSGIVGTLR